MISLLSSLSYLQHQLYPQHFNCLFYPHCCSTGLQECGSSFRYLYHQIFRIGRWDLFTSCKSIALSGICWDNPQSSKYFFYLRDCNCRVWGNCFWNRSLRSCSKKGWLVGFSWYWGDFWGWWWRECVYRGFFWLWICFLLSMSEVFYEFGINRTWGRWGFDCWKWIFPCSWEQFVTVGSQVKDGRWVDWVVVLRVPFWPIYLKENAHKSFHQWRAGRCNWPSPTGPVLIVFPSVHHPRCLGTGGGCWFRIWWKWFNIVVHRSRINFTRIRLGGCWLGSVRFSGRGRVGRWSIVKLGVEVRDGVTRSLRV